MALKDIWTPLQDAVAGVPNSGSDVSSKPINDIADSVIELEENLDSKADKPNIIEISIATTIEIEALPTNQELIYAEVTSISVTFPASVGLNYTSSIIFTTPATLPENYSTFPSDVYFKGDECDGGIFIPNASTRYTMLFYYDGTQIIGLVSGIEVTA